MLPAIYFIFSRRGCDKAVADLGSVSLVNEAEAEQLRWQDIFYEIQKQAALDKFRLYRGIAAHHAGILPA